MSLFKRGNVWWTYYYIDGVRHQESTGATNRRQADAIEMQLKAEANARRHRIVECDPHLTVAALAARFLGDADPRPHHIWHLKSLLPYFGQFAVVRLNRNMAREYRAFRKKNETVCDATINRALSVLKHILYWGVDEQIIQENPLARLPMIQERRIKRPVMTLDEEIHLLPVLPDHLRNIVVTALDTGMRRGEILKQQWEDIDLPRKLLLVSSSKTAGGESREIPLTARMLETISPKSRKEGYLFTYDGRPLEWIRKGFLGGIKRAGLRHFRFHDLRHTFNTRLMEAGVIADVRMAIMGHSSGQKVHSIYTHVELPIKRQAIARLEAWVKQQQEELKAQKDKEQEHASTKERSESADPKQGRGPQTVEEEESR